MMPRPIVDSKHPHRRAPLLVLVAAVCAVIASAGVATGQTIPSIPGGSSSTSTPTTGTTVAPPTTGKTTSTTAKPGTPTPSSVPPPDLPDTADPSALEAANALANAVQGTQVLQAAVSALNGQISSDNTALNDLNERVSLADQSVVLADQDLASVKARVAAVAIARYTGGSYGGLEQVADVLRGADTSPASKTEAIEGASLDYVKGQLRVSQKADDTARSLRSQVASQRDALQQDRDDKTKQRDATQQALNGSAGQASSLRNQVNAAALAAASGGDIGAALNARQAGQVPPPISRIFSWPLTVMHMSSPYGYRSDPVTGATSFHPGADFPQPTGTPIMAAADGVVVIAGPEGGYGNCTVIDVGNALGNLYGHQSAIIVHVGDVVKRGQVIGYVGSTGYSTGPHLHFEVRVQGKPEDPVPWLNPPVS